MTYPRVLDIDDDLKNRSVFLFGPRQTGKTTYLRQRYPTAPFFNLLHGEVFLRLSREPYRLRQELSLHDGGESPIVIDEIQKLPVLLDEIHDLIEARGLRFIMTGSSPVKLRRGSVNLLGGRARIRRLFPLTYTEIPDWNVDRVVKYGSIPSIFLSQEPEQDLKAYCGAYLALEIQAEGIVRGIDAFSRFLQIAALSSGELVNFEAVASDAQVPARTVREYFAVLSDTLVGEIVEPYSPNRNPGRKPVSRGKFYFFDVGVANTLSLRNGIERNSEAYGRALENLIFSELRAWVSYSRNDYPVRFWRTIDGSEVDFVVGDEFAVEVKATGAVGQRDFRGLTRLSDENPALRRYLVCTEPAPRVVDGVHVVPVEKFLAKLWSGRA